MKITEAEVLHVAKLARLRLDPHEVSRFQKELDSILEYMAMLSGTDTSGILPMHHSVPFSNAFRNDETRESQDMSDALSNAPEHRDGYITVPRVIE